MSGLGLKLGLRSSILEKWLHAIKILKDLADHRSSVVVGGGFCRPKLSGFILGGDGQFSYFF